MNILMHCVYFPPEVGGLESHVFHLCRALVEKGHRVTVVTGRSQPGLPSTEVMEGVEVRRTWFPMRNAVGWGLQSVASIPATRAAAREADIVHAQAFASVVPAVAARGVSKAPLVTTFHTSHFLTRAPKRLWKPLLGALVRAADYNLAASREIAKVAEALAPGVSVEALTNGVDTSRFAPTEPLRPVGERRRLVVPRRLFEKNGVEYLVRAMPYIVEAVDAEAVLIGDGPERDRLESLSRELGMEDRLFFLGRRANAEMPGLLCWGEVAVFPSLMEATSVAALEAMACGVPVAASRVGGLPEIVDDSVGGLFEPADPRSLADTVIGLLVGGALNEKAQRARARVVDEWSNDRLAERHLDIYRTLLENRSRKA